MKLTRNKIRKIRKQQQQSVRKWKKARKSMRRRAATFRRSRAEIATDTDNTTSYPLKLKNVFNKTLKRYIPLPVLSYLKERYQNMKRLRRKQRREKMIGGAPGDGDAAAASAAAAAAAAASAAVAAPVVGDAAVVADTAAVGDAAATAGDAAVVADTAATAGDVAPVVGDAAATAGVDKDGEKKPGINLGPEIQGDISIHSETFVLEKKDDAQKLLTFLVKNGLPYYIQLELKPDGKKFNRHDTEIFDLRRILYGKFATKKDFETDGKIPDKKHGMYFKAPDQVGIADGDTMGNENPNDVFIFTGEKGQIDRSSADKSIKIAIAGNNSGPVVVLDSRRLYKLAGNGSPESIADFDTVLKFGDSIDPSEIRLQVVPLSDDDFKKAAAVAASADGTKKGKNGIVDDTNSYVVNLSAGCKVTSIQTLRKALEMVRENLEDEDDDSKSAAMDVFKMLISLLNNPEFVKNEGFDDFKKQVVDFSYKIPGQERKYGLAQLMTFFTETKGLPPALVKEFTNLMRLLDKGPMGENGACAAFDTPGLPIELQTLVTPMADGKVKEVTRITNKGNITGIAGLLEDLQGAATGDNKDEAKAEGAEAKTEGAEAKTEGAEAKTEGAEAKTEGAEAKAEGAEAKAEGAEATTEGAEAKAEGAEAKTEGAATKAEGTAGNESTDTSNMNKRTLSKDDIKEIDAIDSRGARWKAYLIRKFALPDLQDMNLVHFMGWSTQADEFIPAAEEPKRILPRDENSKTGQSQRFDKTIDDVMKLYQDVDMEKMESKAKEKAEEMKEDATPAKSGAAASAAASTAAAAAAATAAAAASTAPPPVLVPTAAG